MEFMNWKNMSPVQKLATVIAGIAVVLWAIAQVKPDILPIDASYIAISVFTLCEAVVCWKQKRKWALLLIAAAVICMACTVLEFMLL